MNKYKIIAWVIFVIGLGINLSLIGDRTMTVALKYAGPELSGETIAKFYTRGFSDHMIQTLPAILLFIISMIILTINKKKNQANKMEATRKLAPHLNVGQNEMMQVFKARHGQLSIAIALVVLGLFPPPVESANTTATLGVYYFEGWYHDVQGSYGAFANEELRNDFPDREPIWGGGLWRGDTVEIMEQQIDLAAQHGITFFSFDWYWYGTPAATTNDGINSGLKHFMMASNRDLMRYNITIVDAAPTTIDSDAEWEQVAQTLLPHLTDAQYLRVGGKPLIINFNPSGMTQTNYDYFQQLATNAGLAGIAFAANVAGSPSLYSHMTRYNAVPGYGAGEASLPYKNLTYYMDGIAPDPSDPWADPGSWNIDVAGMDATQCYIPTVMAGWDPRPWNTPESWYFNDTTWIVGSENWGRTPEAFAEHLQAAIDWIDNNLALATPERLVMIYAWNEYGEGGYIAPTVGDPNGLYLNAIQSVVAIPEISISKPPGSTTVELNWVPFRDEQHIEFTTNLISETWTNPALPVETNGLVRRAFDSIDGKSRGYYRLSPP